MALQYILILCVLLPCVGLGHNYVRRVPDDVDVVHDDIDVVHEDTCPCATELEDVMCAAQCRAGCYNNQNCSSACDFEGLNELERKSWKWWCNCSDSSSYSEWCVLYGRPTGYIPPPPDLIISRDPLTRGIELVWTPDRQDDPSVVYVVLQIDEEEKFITSLDTVQGVNTYNVTGAKGLCDRPYFSLAAVSSFGSSGLIRPVRTPALVPGSPRDLRMTSLTANGSSSDSEFLRYTMAWKAPLGWSVDELEHDLAYESHCPPGPDLDNVVIFHDTPTNKFRDPNVVGVEVDDVMFQMSGKIPSYAIGCNITLKVIAMSTCMGANMAPSNPAVYDVVLRCEDFPSYFESHCEQPEDLEPGPVRDVKMTTVHYDDQVQVLISWLPPDNLDESRQLDHYQVYWGVVVVSPVIMDFAVMLGNSSANKTEIGVDIEVNATVFRSQETVGVVVETLAPGQVLSQPRAAIYTPTVTSTPQFEHGKLLVDDGVVIAVQNMVPGAPPSINESKGKKPTHSMSSFRTTSPADDPSVNEGTTPVRETSTSSLETPTSQETPTSNSDTPTSNSDTPTSSSDTPTSNSDTPTSNSDTPTSNSKTPTTSPGTSTTSPEESNTGADIQVAVYWRRRHWLSDPPASGYFVQWGSLGADIHGNNITQNGTTAPWDEEVRVQSVTEESLYLHHLHKNTTYWIKVKPTSNISGDVVSQEDWDSADVHTFTTMDTDGAYNNHVTPALVPSSENPPPDYHKNGSDVIATSAKPSHIEKDDGGALPTSITVTIVVAALAVVVCVGSVFWCSWKRRQQTSLALVSSSVYRPYSYFIPGKTLSSMRNSQCPMVADEWELPISCVKFGPVLGSGAFGKVVKGRITRAMLTHRGVASLLADYGACLQDGDSLHAIVAIKMLQEDCDVIYKQDFLKEIQLMKKIGYHDNIVSMLGCCTLRDPVCLVVEHVGQGDLLNYLKSIRHKLHNLPVESPHYVNKGVEILDPVDLVRFAWHITRGMEFLASKGFVHRDLAARNVLVGNNKVCKIGDFGLARYVYDNAVYVNRRGGRLPVKWMSVEAIFDMTFSTASDVWSFGVVLFEIVTLGGTPYPTIPTRDLLKELQRGYRMERPENCSQEIYNIMRHCWHEDPASRPSFGSLAHRLENLLSDGSRVSYFDMGMHLGQHLYIDDEEGGQDEITPVQPDQSDTPISTRPLFVGESQNSTPTLAVTFQAMAAVYPPSLSEDSGYVSQQKMSVSSGDSGSTQTCPRPPEDHSPSSISLTSSYPDGEAVVDDVFEGETIPRKSPAAAWPSNQVHESKGLSRSSFGKDVIQVQTNRNRRHSLNGHNSPSRDHPTRLRRCRSDGDLKGASKFYSFSTDKVKRGKPSFYRKVSGGSERSRWAKRYVGVRQRRKAVVVPPTFALDNELYHVVNRVAPPAVQIVRKFKATKTMTQKGFETNLGRKQFQNNDKDVFLNFENFSNRFKKNTLIRRSIRITPRPGVEKITTAAEIHLPVETEVGLSSPDLAHVWRRNAVMEATQHSPPVCRRPLKAVKDEEGLGVTSPEVHSRLTERPRNLNAVSIMSDPGQILGEKEAPNSIPQKELTSSIRGGQICAYQSTPTSTPKSKRTFTKTSAASSKNISLEIQPSITKAERETALKWPPCKHEYQDFNILCHCAPRCDLDSTLTDKGDKLRSITFAKNMLSFSPKLNLICKKECLVSDKKLHHKDVLAIVPGKGRQTAPATQGKDTELTSGHQWSEGAPRSNGEVIDSWLRKRAPSWEDLPSPGRVTSHRRRSSDPVSLQVDSPRSPCPPHFAHEDPSETSPPMTHSVRCFWFPSPRKRKFAVTEDPYFDPQPKPSFPNEKHPSAMHLVSNSPDQGLQVSITKQGHELYNCSDAPMI